MSMRMNSVLSWDEDEAAERLLVGYAHGVLDEALSLLAEVYADLNEQARRHLEEMQLLCGALLEEMSPMAISDACRRNVLSLLDDDYGVIPKSKVAQAGLLPEGLQRCMDARCYEELDWRNRRVGVDEAKLQNMPASVLRVRPGTGNLKPAPHMVRFTLILDGGLMKEGQMMQRGTLHLITPQSQTPVKACEENGCVCLSATESMGGIAGLLGRLLKDI